MLINRQFTHIQAARADSEKPASFPAPALDDAYDFDVTVYCTVRPVGRRKANLWLDETEYVRVIGIIRDIVRKISRDFSIFRPGEAESAINEALRRQFDEMTHAGLTGGMRWTVRAELTLPDEVRALMRKAVQEQHEIDARARATKLRMTKMSDLRRDWEEFLAEAAASPTARQAIQLAEDPQNIAQVLQSVQEEQREGAESLLTLIGKIMDAHLSANTYELVVESETVLRRTLEMMGIELPPMEPDDLLVPIEEDR